MGNTYGLRVRKFGIGLAGLILLGSAPSITPVAHAAEVINVWWPLTGSHVTRIQPFKALVNGLDVSSYDMYWQVDNGQLNTMSNNYTSYPHKESSVDLTNWTWHGTGPYTVNFVAKKSGIIIASQSVSIYVDQTSTATVSTPTTTVSPTTTTVSTRNPLSGLSFYVNPNSSAAKQAQSWQTSNPSGAAMMNTLAAQPTAVWLGEWTSNLQQTVQQSVSTAQQSGKTPIFVAYGIPERDCGGFSSGGINNPTAYRQWIASIAAGIGGGKAVVVLEPDALAQITCLSSADQSTRLSLISSAVNTLKANAGTTVYIDAGHSNWISSGTMANLLTQANVGRADGFALNVSNFMPLSGETAYGTDVSNKTGQKHFVIDTSRNGNGSDGTWCNPPGRAIGKTPTTATGNGLIDGLLWLKVPGESDGTCNGGPSAGSWWTSYALSLVSNVH